MIITILDGNGAPQLVSWQGPGTAQDASGPVLPSLPAGGPFTYQQLLPDAATGSYRGGWFVRNRGTNQMRVTEDGTDPSTSATAIVVYPGETFPTPGVPYPITQGSVNIAGTTGDGFGCKVW